jgi:very-short-patch-repair endonuclease
MLVIEIDGDVHGDPDQAKYDEARRRERTFASSASPMVRGWRRKRTSAAVIGRIDVRGAGEAGASRF